MWVLARLKDVVFLFGSAVLGKPATSILNMTELRLGNIRVIKEENNGSIHEKVTRN